MSLPFLSSPRILTIGSINMDLVVKVERLPRPGETISGQQLLQIPGGKGANQAVAVARLGGQSTLVGRVGDDGFGSALIQSLQGCGVRTEFIQITPECSSGVAIIGVEHSGENSITIIPGANGRLLPEDLAALESLIADSQAVICQLEVPQETVAQAMTLARRHGVLSVLDPAPAPTAGLLPELLQCDLISPNQTEAELLTGIAVVDEESARRAAEWLHDRGAVRVALKLGALGALYSTKGNSGFLVPAPSVQVVDTTAAGDAFTAGLVCGLVQGWEPQLAVEFACCVGSLATTRLGAQPALPTLQEVEAFRNGTGKPAPE